MSILKGIGGRVGLLVVGFAMLLELDALGWLDAIVAHPLGLVAYWGYAVGLLMWLIFGVARPITIYLSTKESQIAKLLTALYRPSRRGNHQPKG